MNHIIKPVILVFAFVVGFISIGNGQTKLEHIDPPNWWVGMVHNNVQIMFHGKNIGRTSPTVKYDGIEIEQIITTTNPNYIFIDISISHDAEPGEAQFVFTNNGMIVATYAYPILKREYSKERIQGFDNSDVLYLITPDRFANGDEQNDEISGLTEKLDRANKGGRHGGDIEGIRKNLNYIKEMGFTSIWLNPLLENNMEVYSYHGYSTTDFYKVDPRFGSNASYKQLSEEARSKGIKLIMDMIVNHCGSFHWWMNDMPTKDWINTWPTMTYTNHKKTLWQDPYASVTDKKIFADGWFVETMPDLNQRNKLMSTYLIQNSIWWVEYLGLAGIRMDTYPYPEMDFMTTWTEEVMKEYPNFNIVGEEWNEVPSTVAYWQKGKENPNGYTSELKSLMDFPVQAAMSKALREEETWGKGWIGLYETVARDFVYASPDDLVIFPDNHDMSRIFSQVNEDFGLFKMAIAYVATMRGVPQYYYGTEILMKNPGTTDHGIIRSDFPGGWKGDVTNGFNGNGLTDQEKEAQIFIKKLLTWRKTADVVHNGELTHFVPENGIYVYFRYDDQGQKIMVIMNKNENDTLLDMSRFKEILGQSKQGLNILTDKLLTYHDDSLNVPKRDVLILEIE